MADTTRSKRVTETLGTAGRRTARGAGTLSMAALTVLAKAGHSMRRDEVREQLEVIRDHDLEIALEIIEERIERKNRYR